MPMKLLSIIIPSYNMERYLPKCLDSLITHDIELQQQLDVIVVNDGSKDRTSEIAHEYERRYPGVFTVVDKENGHYGSCINAGLDVARGKYIRTLDADDSYNNKELCEFLRYLSTVGDVDLIVTDFCNVNAEGIVTALNRFSFPACSELTLDDMAHADETCICHFSACYRTAILRNMGYRQIGGTPYTDMQWSLVPMTYVRKAKYLPICVYRYLVGRDGQTMQPTEVCAQIDKQANVALAVYKELLRRKAERTPESNFFWKRALVKSVLWISRIYAIGYDDIIPGSSGRDFDLTVKELLPETYAEVEDVVNGRYLKFHYVRAWRNDYDRRSFAFKAYRLYRRCRSILKRLSHH